MTFQPERLRTLGLCAASFAAGLVFSFGFAPYSWSFLGFAGLSSGLMIVLASSGPLKAFWRQFLFGLGWFLPGLSWTMQSVALHGRLGWTAAFGALLCLAAACSALTALAASAAVAVTRRDASRLFVLPVFLAAAEWIRGPGFFDFSWLTPAYAAVDSAWLAWAPLLGLSGLNLLYLACAAAAGCALFVFGGFALHARSLTAPVTAVCALLVPAAFWAGGLVLERTAWSETGDTLECRLLQPNLPVVDAFTQATSGERLRVLEGLARRAPFSSPNASAVTLTPEGVLVQVAERLSREDREALESLLRATGGQTLYSGFRTTPRGYANSAFWTGADGATDLVVDKRKLVPFGEFVPRGFRWFTDLLGIPLSNLARGGSEPPLLPAGNLRLGVLICYENVDGERSAEFWRGDASPDLLVVTANLGWFSEKAVSQHLDMTRMRAAETARPVVSIVNNGGSAIVDAHGAVAASLPMNEAAAECFRLASARGKATPAVRFGSLTGGALAALMLVCGVFCALYRRRERHRRGFTMRGDGAFE